MENIEQLIEFLGELKGVVATHVNCDVELDVVIVKLSRKKAAIVANARFDGMSDEDIDMVRKLEREDEIEALQAEAAEVWKLRKVLVEPVIEIVEMVIASDDDNDDNDVSLMVNFEIDTVDTEVKPVVDTVDTEVKPVVDTVDTEVKPVVDAVDTEVKPVVDTTVLSVVEIKPKTKKKILVKK